MKLKQGFVTHTIQDTQMLVAAGKAAKLFHGLARSNETAAFIVDCLKQETTEAEIVEKLLAQYEVAPEVAKKDVAGIIAKLRGINALEG